MPWKSCRIAIPTVICFVALESSVISILKKKLAVFDILDRRRLRRIESARAIVNHQPCYHRIDELPCTVWSTLISSPALIGVKRPNELIAA